MYRQKKRRHKSIRVKAWASIFFICIAQALSVASVLIPSVPNVSDAKAKDYTYTAKDIQKFKGLICIETSISDTVMDSKAKALNSENTLESPEPASDEAESLAAEASISDTVMDSKAKALNSEGTLESPEPASNETEGSSAEASISDTVMDSEEEALNSESTLESSEPVSDEAESLAAKASTSDTVMDSEEEALNSEGTLESSEPASDEAESLAAEASISDTVMDSKEEALNSENTLESPEPASNKAESLAAEASTSDTVMDSEEEALNSEGTLESPEPVSDEAESLAAEARTYTEKDVQMLGDLMYAEVGVFLSTLSYEEAKRAHLLTGSVVLHRVEVQLDGATTIEEVIFDERGYAQRTKNLIGNIDTPKEVYQWAEELLRDGPLGPRNLIFQAQFIQGEIYEIIDNTYFCLGNV